MRTLLLLLSTTLHCCGMGLQSHVFIAATVQPSAAGASFPSGATHYWTLDEASGTRDDAVGTVDLDETTAVASGTGKDSNAAQFDWNGTSFGQLDDGVNITVPSEFSLCGWFKFSSVAANQVITVSAMTTGGFSVGFSANCTTDLLLFSLSEEDNLTIGFTPDTSFHLFCLTATGTTAKIYMDGTEVASDAGKTIDFDDWDSFRIVASNSGTTSGTVGLVDEVVFFPLVPTPTDISNMWNAGTGRFGP